MSNDKVVPISAKRLGFLNPKEAEGGVAALGKVMKEFCGIDLLKVGMIMKTIEPLLRIEERTPEAFERKRKEYREAINAYDEKTSFSILNNSKEEELKRRPIFFSLLIERAFKKNIPDFPQT